MATIAYSWRNIVPSFLVNTLSTAGSQSDPAIGVLSDGSYVAGWTAPAQGRSLRFIGADGVLGLGGSRSGGSDAAFARLADGSLASSYTDRDVDAGGDITVAVGEPSATDVNINNNSGDDQQTDIVALPDGGYVVTWTRVYSGGDTDISAAVMNANGSFRAGGDSAGLTVSSLSTGISSFGSSVAVCTGGFVVAWTEQNAIGGGSTSIHYRLYNSDGSPRAGHVPLDDRGSENEDVQVIGLRDGGFAFAYEEDSYGAGTDITLWIFNFDGSSRTFLRANTTAAGNQINPTLAILDNGFIVVGWRNDSTQIIHYQVFTPAGVAVGPETAIVGLAGTVEIAALGNGRVANVHQSNVSDGDGTSIQSSIDQFVRTTTGDATAEALYGDSLPDIMLGNGGNDGLVGMAGDDNLSGGAGDDFLFGAAIAGSGEFGTGSGDDTLDGGANNDGLWGGDGNDTLNGGAGNDGMCGGAGDDELNGGEGGDFLFGGDFSVANGSRLPGSGKDTLNGDSGNDALYGFDDGDIINGGSGNDYVEAGEGADVIDGGADSDTLLGQAGADTLSGRSGFDYLYGGSGLDTFIVRVGDSYDTVWDFSLGEEDKLRLDPGFGVATLAAFKARATTFVFEGKNYTQFTSTDGADQITLAGVRPDQLTAANFELLLPV